MLLHTVNKSPFERNTLESCLRVVKDGASVLLIEDGVYAALDNTAMSDLVKKRMGDVKFYVLGPDVDARGLGNKSMIDGIESVDYAGFVDLVEKHSATQAWM